MKPLKNQGFWNTIPLKCARACAILKYNVQIMTQKGATALGYRKYAKDYEIEYIDRIGKRKPEAVRIYVGPYFRFEAPAEKIARLKVIYLALAIISAAALLVPMCVDCEATRTWYVQIPGAVAWIPWVLAACSVWRLWTAKDKVEREHYDMLYQRMSGSSLFMIVFGLISFIGSIVFAAKGGASVADLYIGTCYLIFTVCAVVMLIKKKDLKMTEEENPEKPQAKK